jgi:hypothetical protein
MVLIVPEAFASLGVFDLAYERRGVSWSIRPVIEPRLLKSPEAGISDNLDGTFVVRDFVRQNQEE